MNKNPCQGCTDRHRVCWSDCEKEEYKEYRRGIDERHAEEEKRREINGFEFERRKKIEKFKQKLVRQGLK